MGYPAVRIAHVEESESSWRLAPLHGHFAVVGDLQPTSHFEVWRESNVRERERLVEEIAASEPDFVVLLGDLVFCGSSSAQWRSFEQLCRPLVEARLPLLPVLGNHEYWWTRSRALDRFFSRFPHLQGANWYARRYGPLGLVFLDSNVRRLPPGAWREQIRWLGETLAAFDRDPACRGVLLLLHHPPYTNSTITADERHVQRDLVPPFATARKTLAMMAGHVHSYERFERSGKLYVVAGGGAARGPGSRRGSGAATPTTSSRVHLCDFSTTSRAGWRPTLSTWRCEVSTSMAMRW
jgi:3',5'-cyclic AMP phosphodiesterase CpdA